MDQEKQTALAERANTLRAELKVWERGFSAANTGQKASRDDVKKHPDIATKYKEYNRARDILSGKTVQPPPVHHHTPRKRKQDDSYALPTIKRFQIIKTPSKGSMKPWEVDPYDSPSAVRNLFTPSRKAAIGPTPQKDGQVLGIFDLLEESKTPSKGLAGRGAGMQMPAYATPRKPTGQAHGTPSHGRTPSSIGKRASVDKFGTPTTKLYSNKQIGGTPSSVSKLHFSTPSFLKRDSQRPLMPPTGDDDEFVALSPEAARVPRKPLVRGLSSILAGLRKIEEEAADDDLDALREVENEMGPNNPPPKTKALATEATLVEDSQLRLPLGGFDDEGKYDSEPEEMTNTPLGRDGKPPKEYKKKGQKRTTRRVNLKPNRSKPQTEPGRPQSDSEDEPTYAAEMPAGDQIDDAAGFEEARNFDSDSQSEYTASEGGTRYRRPDQSKKRERGKDGKLKPVARKVNALAHQNFKRLKLRNSGAKGGPAHNSRFRRKR